MITNMNVRALGNGHILVQYQEDGKAKDAGFNSWEDFIEWQKAMLGLHQHREECGPK